MRFKRILGHRFNSLFKRSQTEEDLRREMDVHIDQLAKEYVASGMSQSDALLAAKREFGSVSLAEEQCRDARATNFIEELIRNLTFAYRAFKKSPVFTLTAVLSLALGIGANTAIYSFMDAVMLRALPVPNPKNLVIVNWRAKGSPKVAHSWHGDGYTDPGGISVAPIFPYQAYQALRDRNESLSSLFAFVTGGRFNLVAQDQAFLGGGEYVSGSYFRGVGAPPAAGRLLDDQDDRPGASSAAVISYHLWQQHFNSSPNAVGQTIFVNRTPFTIAGVTAPEFYGVSPRDAADIFLPLHTIQQLDPRLKNDDWFHQNTTYWLQMMGRLRPGVSIQQAELPMAAVFHGFVAPTAVNDKERATLPQLWLEPGGSGVDALRRRYSKPLFILIAMTALILAIACSNIANLLLSRGSARRREIAVRISLGAGRWRIVRQLLTESVLLALVGGTLGLLVAESGIHFLTWLLANGQQDFTLNARIDFRILLFAFLVSVLTGILFGIAPAVRATQIDVSPALKESRSAAVRLPRWRLPFGLSHALVVGQIALSLLLVVAAALFVKTLSNLHSISIGFNTEKLMMFSLDAHQAGYDEHRAATFYEDLRERFANLPGVRGATMSDMPLVSDSASSTGIIVPGIPSPKDSPTATSIALVGPSFFETMQIPMLLGRSISERDALATQPYVVVNEVFAKKYFPGRDAIGQHFEFDDKTDVQIIGVARNTLYSSLKDRIPPVTYAPWNHAPANWLIGGMYYEIRTTGDPSALANTVRQVVREANPKLPVADMSTQERYIEATIASERTFANLCTCFGLLALLIACVGLYGAMTYDVARRTNEIGIRMALGAQRTNVIWMVQREVLLLCLVGLAIGVAVAWESARFVASFLFGVRPNDTATFALAALILTICTLAAGYAPAWRASRIDPMEALRNE